MKINFVSFFEIQGDIKKEFNEKCAQTLLYLNEMQKIDSKNDQLKKAHCVYLYYILYDSYYKKGKNGSEIKKLFNELITLNNRTQDPQCTNYNDITITDDERSKLKVIHDMYTKLAKINCETNISGHNCDCAKKCADTYKTYIKKEIYWNYLKHQVVILEIINILFYIILTNFIVYNIIIRKYYLCNI
ncbi:variable surface protein [Plasmodium gonderi]|uniref:Variable surface protein n=1 Tax=Plasmodium gonderi TaxID=77519 RepID=A0A1Y1JN82_PLAGO|nr:variable surface protein [Plasmodium gonderi]GAW84056.1 variable surface protein [Plasmodium gonderi]